MLRVGLLAAPTWQSVVGDRAFNCWWVICRPVDLIQGHKQHARARGGAGTMKQFSPSKYAN